MNNKYFKGVNEKKMKKIDKFNKSDLLQDFKNVPLKTFSIKRKGNYELQDLHYFVSRKYFFAYLERINNLDDEFLYYR